MINRMIEPGQNIWIVWDNPLVVCREIAYFITAAVVRSSINRIAIAGHKHFFLERFWKTFTTLSIFHARSVRFPTSTWSMDHTMLNNVKQLRFSLRVQPCCTDHGVDLLCSC
jgi:hypothetical protein